MKILLSLIFVFSTASVFVDLPSYLDDYPNVSGPARLAMDGGSMPNGVTNVGRPQWNIGDTATIFLSTSRDSQSGAGAKDSNFTCRSPDPILACV